MMADNSSLSQPISFTDLWI